jgi:hypothetical protein
MATKRSKVSNAKVGKPETAADKKSTPVEGQNPVSRLKALGGGDYDQWNSRIGHRLFAAMPGIKLENAEEAGRAAPSGLLDINSTDPIEGMLAAQVIAAPSRVQSRLKDIGYAKEVLAGLVLTDDGLQRIAIDRERIRTFVEADASR